MTHDCNGNISQGNKFITILVGGLIITTLAGGIYLFYSYKYHNKNYCDFEHLTKTPKENDNQSSLYA